MKIKKFIRFCCFLLVFFSLFLLCSFSIAAAAVPGFVSINDSEVTDDLKKIGISFADYPKEEGSSHIRMLYFLEYGYDYYLNTTDYGLYVYLYNPTGKKIESGHIQIYTSLNDTVLSGNKKYILEVLDASELQGYENVFYKCRVMGAKELVKDVSRGKRSYNVVGVEIKHRGDSMATDYKVAGRYSFTGYVPYHDQNKSVSNSLYQYVTDIIAVDLELHPFSWKTKSSDKGAGWQYELSSVYFSVPEDIIRDYGNENDVTRGLVRVKGTYNEQGLNGLITSNQGVYQAALNAIGKDPRRDSISLSFHGAYTLSGVMGTSASIPTGGFGFNRPDYVPVTWNVRGLCFSALQGSAYFQDIPQVDFLNSLRDVWNEQGAYFMTVDDGRKQGYQEYIVNVDDGDLAAQIQTYASNHNKFVSWWKGEYDCYFADEYYEGIEPIEYINSNMISSVYSDSYLSSMYFVSESEVSSLRALVSSDERDNRVPYLLRFAITDYYFEACDAYLDGAKTNGAHYYFQKTVFKDFDILELTYENEYSRRTVLPVVASPIDVVGSLTPTRPDQGPSALDKLGEVLDGMGKYSAWVLVLALVLAVALLFLLIGFLPKAFVNFIVGIFRSLARLPAKGYRRIRQGLKSAKKKDKTKKGEKSQERGDAHSEGSSL